MSDRQRRTTVVLLGLALLVAAALQSVFINWTSDDAFISFRYAENLSRGAGLVFNEGEYVEGFSNLLWVLVLAFFHGLGLSTLWTAKALSFILMLLMVPLLFRTARLYGLRTETARLCSLSLACSSGLAYFAMSGLETVLNALLLLLLVFFNKVHERDSRPASFRALYAAGAALALTRPEGVVFLGVATGYHLAAKLITKRGLPLAKMLKVQISVSLLYGLVLLLRSLYYSRILPNTFYAKPAGTFVEDGGGAFFANFVNAFFSGSFLLVPILIFLHKRTYLKKHLFPLALCLGQLVFMSYAGDWMAFGRFFIPILPLVLLLFFSLLDSISTRGGTGRSLKPALSLAAAVFVLFAGTNAVQTQKALKNPDIYPFLVMKSTELVEAGRRIRNDFPASSVIALRRQGAIPYYSEMTSIDILGLTDRSIAGIIYRSKSNETAARGTVDRVLELRPDIFILFSFLSDYEGWEFASRNPGEKFYYLEHLIFENALKEGYIHLEPRPLGRLEHMHILISPEMKSGLPLLAEGRLDPVGILEKSFWSFDDAP